MPRRTPPPYYRVTIEGPEGTFPYRRRAADEYNELRLELGVSDRTLADMLEVDKGKVGRWGRGADVPYWIVLRLHDMVNALRSDTRTIDDRRDEAAIRIALQKAHELSHPPEGRRERGDKSDYSAAS